MEVSSESHGIPLSKILEAFDGKTALVAAHDLGEKSLAKGFGTVITEGTGKLRPVTAFEEKPLEPKTSLVSTGCSVIPKALLPHVREFAKRKPDNVGGLFEELLKEGHSVKSFVILATLSIFRPRTLSLELFR
jgi:glucose-1-phosphate thymidylyltransferase